MNINAIPVQSGRMFNEDASIINKANAFKQIKDGVVTHTTTDSFRVGIIDGNAYKMSFADVTGIPAGASYIYYVKNIGDKDIWLRTIDFNPGTFLLQVVKSGIFAIDSTEYDMENYIGITIEATTTTGSPLITGTFDTTYIKVGMSITGAGIPVNTFVGAVTTEQITMVTANAGAANATESGTITATIEIPTLPARNLNSNSSNVATLKTYFQNATVLGGAVTWEDTAADKILKTIEWEMDTPSMLGEAMSIIKPGDSFVSVLTNYGTEKIPYRISVEWSEV